MRYKPVDEMSLRHLFSTQEAENILKLQYLGPVLNDDNLIEESPDAWILDKRSKPFRILRAEFKYMPDSAKAFKDNGIFDIAIVWDLPRNVSKSSLENSLYEQNKCEKVLIVRGEHKYFLNLKPYKPNVNDFVSLATMEKLLIKSSYPKVFGAYIAASCYPDRFDGDKLLIILKERFESVRKMRAKGRGNLIGCFVQSIPVLYKRQFGSCYEWNNSEVEASMAATKIVEILTVRFNKALPSKEDVDRAKYTD